MIMYRRRENTAKKIAIGSAIAGALGYVAGVLTAPKSGSETRQDVKNAADKGAKEAEKDVQQLQVEIDKVIRQAKIGRDKLSKTAQQELNELVDKAKDNKNKAGEVLSAVRAGEAEDRDLDRAVKAASRSLEHLRKYLKK
jgi:gas vesicle protein